MNKVYCMSPDAMKKFQQNITFIYCNFNAIILTQNMSTHSILLT